jgi:hypothetical protein
MHPSVTRVELAGSRSRGTHTELSDWDFDVKTADFKSVACDLRTLVEPLGPLAAQWEPLGHFPVYMLLLSGPTKVEYLFLEHSQRPKPPLQPSKETLLAIDAHFWDWIWWLATKASIGRDDLVAEHLPQLYRHVLRPLEAGTMPRSIEAAVRVFLDRRHEFERQYGISVPRELEDEVRRGMRRLGHTT